MTIDSKYVKCVGPREEGCVVQFCFFIIIIIFLFAGNEEREARGRQGRLQDRSDSLQVNRKEGRGTQPCFASEKLVRRGCPGCSPA